jgi:hypothetical protein
VDSNLRRHQQVQQIAEVERGWAGALLGFQTFIVIS